MKVSAAMISPNSARMDSEYIAELKRRGSAESQEMASHSPFVVIDEDGASTETNLPASHSVEAPMESTFVQYETFIEPIQERFLLPSNDFPNKARFLSLVPRPSAATNPFCANIEGHTNDRHDHGVPPVRNVGKLELDTPRNKCQQPIMMGKPPLPTVDSILLERWSETHHHRLIQQRTTQPQHPQPHQRHSKQPQRSTTMRFDSVTSEEHSCASSGRSHSRTIHRSTIDNERFLLEEAQRTHAEQLYRLSTWGMYCRIIAYRAKHPLPADYEETIPTTACSSDLPLQDHQQLMKLKGMSTPSTSHEEPTSLATYLHAHHVPDTNHHDEDLVFEIEI